MSLCCCVKPDGRQRFAALDGIRESASHLKDETAPIRGVPNGFSSQFRGAQGDVGPGKLGLRADGRFRVDTVVTHHLRGSGALDGPEPVVPDLPLRRLVRSSGQVHNGQCTNHLRQGR
jgi:hypothetical protein